MSKINLHIVGSAYSGSTLLGNILNSHTQMNTVGEIHLLSTWKDYQFGGIKRDNCTLCSVKHQFCPRWTPELFQQLERGGFPQLYNTLRSHFGGDVIVDTSKYFQWIKHLEAKGTDLTDSRFVVLSRTPFSFVTSVRRRDNIDAYRSARDWVATYGSTLATLAQKNYLYQIVRYEELMLKPRETLQSICSFLGLTFEEQMLSFWETPVHQIAGNAGAYVWYEGAGNIPCANAKDQQVAESYGARKFNSGWCDEKWRQELSQMELLKIISAPRLIHTMEMLGYAPWGIVNPCKAEQVSAPLRLLLKCKKSRFLPNFLPNQTNFSVSNK